jgi:hypothetical protein
MRRGYVCDTEVGTTDDDRRDRRAAAAPAEN